MRQARRHDGRVRYMLLEYSSSLPLLSPYASSPLIQHTGEVDAPNIIYTSRARYLLDTSIAAGINMNCGVQAIRARRSISAWRKFDALHFPARRGGRGHFRCAASFPPTPQLRTRVRRAHFVRRPTSGRCSPWCCNTIFSLTGYRLARRRVPTMLRRRARRTSQSISLRRYAEQRAHAVVVYICALIDENAAEISRNRHILSFTGEKAVLESTGH